jgi:transcriptional regulator with XRE-family HTH domain
MDTRIGVLPMATDLHRQATPGAPEGAMAYIKRVRDGLGIKQRVIADALGMLPGQYSGMEKNSSFGYLPRPDQLEIICGILRITQMEVIRAAGYLTDVPAARRLDDDGDDWIAEQDRIAAALGPEQMQRFAERIVEVAQEEFLPKRPAVERQKGFGNL